MHQFHVYERQGRIFQRLSGFLSRAEAVRDDVAAACRRIDAPGALTMLADLSDYPAQSQDVSGISMEIAAILAAAAPAGFAVVTGSALQRVRLRRVMDAARPRFFETVAAAAVDLDWEPAFLAAINSPGTQPFAVSPRVVPR